MGATIIKKIIAALTLALCSTAANAANYTLTITGNVASVVGFANGGVTAAPPGLIAVGDSINVTATFNTDLAELTPLYDSDPTVNIYYFPGTHVTATFGAYTTSFTPSYDFNSSVQIWDNRVVGNNTVDAQSFSFFNYNMVPSDGVYSFSLGAGQKSENFIANAFDFTATARTSDLLPLTPGSDYASRSFSYVLYNADTQTDAIVNSGNVTYTLTAAPVPEPGEWAMMTAGLGIVWAVVRRRKGDMA